MKSYYPVDEYDLHFISFKRKGENAYTMVGDEMQGLSEWHVELFERVLASMKEELAKPFAERRGVIAATTWGEKRRKELAEREVGKKKKIAISLDDLLDGI